MQFLKLLNNSSFKEGHILRQFSSNFGASDHIISWIWMHKDRIWNISNISLLPEVNFMGAKQILSFVLSSHLGEKVLMC